MTPAPSEKKSRNVEDDISLSSSVFVSFRAKRRIPVLLLSTRLFPFPRGKSLLPLLWFPFPLGKGLGVRFSGPARDARNFTTPPSTADHHPASKSNTNTAQHKRSRYRSSPHRSQSRENPRNSPAKKNYRDAPTPTAASPAATPAAHNQSKAQEGSTPPTQLPRYL